VNRLVYALPLALLLVAGCGSKPAEQPAPTTNATPPSAATPAAPPADTAAPAVLAKSLYDGGPRASASPVNAALAAEGETLFKTKICATCHGWGKKITCPDLKGITSQRTAEWMGHQIMHPDVMTKTDPISHDLMKTYKLQMPNQALTQDQATRLIEYLKQRDKLGR
jgi:cytochrome c551/c552